MIYWTVHRAIIAPMTFTPVIKMQIPFAIQEGIRQPLPKLPGMPTTSASSRVRPPLWKTRMIPLAQRNYKYLQIYESLNKNYFFSYIICLVQDGVHTTNMISCPANMYYSTSTKACTATLPDGCVEATTTTNIPTTIPTTTTTVLSTTTTTAKPWSAEETCRTVTKSTSFANEDDPTCTT